MPPSTTQATTKRRDESTVLRTARRVNRHITREPDDKLRAGAPDTRPAYESSGNRAHRFKSHGLGRRVPNRGEQIFRKLKRPDKCRLSSLARRFAIADRAAPGNDSTPCNSAGADAGQHPLSSSRRRYAFTRHIHYSRHRRDSCRRVRHHTSFAFAVVLSVQRHATAIFRQGLIWNKSFGAVFECLLLQRSCGIG